MTAKRADAAGRRRSPRGGLEPTPRGEAIRFVDFAIRAWREHQYVQLIAHSTPAGAMRHPVAVKLGSFDPVSYRVQIDEPLAQGAAVGRELSRLLLPPEIWRLFAESLAAMAARPELGLRIRLCLDEDLIDLPWEFLYRPDVEAPAAQSGFLLTDGRISLIREAPSLMSVPSSSIRRQRGLFVGAIFDDGSDSWRVGIEYNDLHASMRQVKNLLDFQFVRADDTPAVERALADGCDVFHYAGHTDIADGRGTLVQLARSDQLQTLGFSPDAAPGAAVSSLEALKETAPWAASDVLAARLASSGTRLAVFNACNSGLWPFVKPLMGAGIPAVIGVQGLVSNYAALNFAQKFYRSLAVGLSLDEALTYARLYIIEPEHSYYPCDWGRFMAYLPTESAIVFPRPQARMISRQQSQVRAGREATLESMPALVQKLDGAGVSRLLSEVALRTVLILGRFSDRRKPVLDLIRRELSGPGSRYVPLVFDFERPGHRTMLETVMSIAGSSRFVIADLSEPKWVMTELQKIVDAYPSVPVVPVIDASLDEDEVLTHFEAFKSVHRRVTYRDQPHLRAILGTTIIPAAENLLRRLKPQAVT